MVASWELYGDRCFKLHTMLWVCQAALSINWAFPKDGKTSDVQWVRVSMVWHPHLICFGCSEYTWQMTNQYVQIEEWWFSTACGLSNKWLSFLTSVLLSLLSKVQELRLLFLHWKDLKYGSSRRAPLLSWRSFPQELFLELALLANRSAQISQADRGKKQLVLRKVLFCFIFV